MANKAAANEKRIEGLETSDENSKSDIATMKSTIKTLENRLAEVEKGQGENSGEKVMEEMAERGSRERNGVCHKCPQSAATDE